MSKILIIGDVHFGNHSNKDIEKAQLEAFEQIYHYAKDNDIEKVFFAGDIIHNASKIDVNTLKMLNHCFSMLSCIVGANKYSISGNHDQQQDNFFDLENNYLSTADSFVNQCQNLVSLDNNYDFFSETVYGIPFYRNATDFYKALEMIQLEENTKNILIIHQTPNTTPFSENCSDTIDINHELFKHFDLVFCGHIHEAKQLSNKFYQTGSLVPLNRSENTQKYFYVVDTKTLEVTPVPIKTSIEFTEKKRVENNIKLSTQVREKAESFDLQKEVTKYAAENQFTDFQKDFSINLIKKI